MSITHGLPIRWGQHLGDGVLDWTELHGHGLALAHLFEHFGNVCRGEDPFRCDQRPRPQARHVANRWESRGEVDIGIFTEVMPHGHGNVCRHEPSTGKTNRKESAIWTHGSLTPNSPGTGGNCGVSRT